MRKDIFKFNQSTRTINIIIIINIVVFVISNLFISYIHSHKGEVNDFVRYLALNSELKSLLYRPWTLITNIFTHFELSHLFFNMLYLWSFGKILQSTYSSRSVLNSFFLGGLSGGLVYMLTYSLFYPENSVGLAIGASGGVMAIMFAAMTVNPNRVLNLFIIGQIKIKWIVWFLFITSSILDFNDNTGGKMAHVGGALFGYFYISYLNKGINICAWFDNLIEKFTYKKFNPHQTLKEEYGFRGAQDRRDSESKSITKNNIKNKLQAESEMDSLLVKVKKLGYNNLPQKDKERLTELSNFY